ncbi:MAG: aspartate/glutamate racemase family protein [Roseobacter sp.]
MSVIIINPNSTSTMTDSMMQVAQHAVPELSFEGWTSHLGPASIQGEADGLSATPPFLDLVLQANEASAECIIIGCFDDTALEEAAALSSCPVIGIGQAAYHYAALRNWRFSVVTTLAVSVPILEGNIERNGLSRFLGDVRASDVAVLELEDDLIQAEGKILAEARRAEQEDGIDALILGCAGMVQVTQTVRKNLTIHVLDPVEIAATCAAWLVHR